MEPDFSFEELVQAYYDCRQRKRNTQSALDFESRLERNLNWLDRDLRSGQYRPGKSICFVITRPKPREVWAADFRDRIVHHLLYNRIAARFHARFIADSCACIPGRGTLYGAKRLESKIRSLTQNWAKPAFYLKCDLANFFVSIDKRIVLELLTRNIPEPWWLWLTRIVLMHDPRQDVDIRSSSPELAKVPPHKRLFSQPPEYGLPIGNLSSQFFANVLLNELDQFAKHRIGARHYVRYVDDFILLHESSQWLQQAHDQIAAFLPDRLGLSLNPVKTILQPVDRGVDFVGQVIRPWRRTPRKRTVNDAMKRIEAMPADQVYESANSYFGLLRQSPHSHRLRADLANAVRRRGHSVNAAFTKSFRRSVVRSQPNEETK